MITGCFQIRLIKYDAPVIHIYCFQWQPFFTCILWLSANFDLSWGVDIRMQSSTVSVAVCNCVFGFMSHHWKCCSPILMEHCILSNDIQSILPLNENRACRFDIHLWNCCPNALSWTYWGWDKMANVLQTTFEIIFFNENDMPQSLNLCLELFEEKITYIDFHIICHHWYQRGIQSQHINSLWPNGSTQHHKSWSTLIQIKLVKAITGTIADLSVGVLGINVSEI